MDKTFLARLARPTSEYRGMPFWAWNGNLEPAELRRQIRLMHRMGLGGFFMHSRVGLQTPYLAEEWMACIDACVDEAAKLGMQAWLYDEDRWPSGFAGGLVTRHEAYRKRALVLRVLKKPAELRWGKELAAAFMARVEGRAARDVRRIATGRRPARLARGESILAFAVEMDQLSDYYNGYTYVDTLNDKAIAEFLKVTHEAYRRRFGRHFGRTIPGIFTDEPNHGGKFQAMMAQTSVGAPWTGRLPASFRRRYGYDLLDHLVELFFDVDGAAVTPARLHYHDCVTHLFVEAFSRQIGQWCGKHGLLHTGHVLEEDTLSSQTNMVGSAMRFYEHMQAPGMDLLTERRAEFDTAKQVSSAARQFSKRWRLTETYGCTGWDFPFLGHKALGDWQVAMGINFRCPHLSWYTMAGEAKRDYPASIFYQSPWWPLYPKVEDYFARVHVAMTRGQEVRDLLVVHPVESMWAMCRLGWRRDQRVQDYDLMFQRLRNSLLGQNIDFDYGDEDILARHGRIRGGRTPVLRVARATYKAVLVPPMITMRASTLALLEKFAAAGGRVVFAGQPARYVDGSPSPAVRDFARRCPAAPARGPQVAAAVDDLCRRVSIADGAGRQIVPALHLLREDARAFYLFICNTGYDFTAGRYPRQAPLSRDRLLRFDEVRVTGLGECRGEPVELDPQTGELLAAEARRTAAGWQIRTSLPALGSRVFILPKRAGALKAARRPKLKDVRTQVLRPARWPISLWEPNALVLDRPRYRINGGPWQAAQEILRVDVAVRQALHLRPRGAYMVQPWAQVRRANPPAAIAELVYPFDIHALPAGELKLALEDPGRFTVALNGRTVSTDSECGWWVDRSLRLLPLEASALRLGTNQLTLTCRYDENFSGLEIVYLLGNFGTQAAGAAVALTRPPTSLRLGDWVKQGLAFYGGSVSYVQTVRPRLAARQRLFVQIPEYRGAAVRIWIDGQDAGLIAWPPNELEVTGLVKSGQPSTLAIEVLGHRRNSHGPLHYFVKWPHWTGPEQFISQADQWTDNYQLVPCGLMAPPRLIVRSEN